MSYPYISEMYGKNQEPATSPVTELDQIVFEKKNPDLLTLDVLGVMLSRYHRKGRRDE